MLASSLKSPKAIKLGGREFTFCRPKLKKWLELEDIREDLDKAIKNWDSDLISNLSLSYVSSALDSRDVFDYGDCLGTKLRLLFVA